MTGLLRALRILPTPNGRRNVQGDHGDGEAGFTLVELMVSTLITGIVVAGAGSALVTMANLAVKAGAMVQSIDQAHLAVQGIVRQVSSALVIYDPATEGNNAGTNPDGSPMAAGFSLRVYTESNGSYLCGQWRLLDDGELQTRTWLPNWTSGMPVSAWIPLAQDIAVPAPNQIPFTLDTNPGFGGPGSSGGTNSGRLLDINMIAQQPRAGAPVQLSTSVTGRDVGYLGPNADACNAVPPP